MLYATWLGPPRGTPTAIGGTINNPVLAAAAAAVAPRPPSTSSAPQPQPAAAAADAAVAIPAAHSSLEPQQEPADSFIQTGSTHPGLRSSLFAPGFFVIPSVPERPEHHQPSFEHSSVPVPSAVASHVMAAARAGRWVLENAALRNDLSSSLQPPLAAHTQPQSQLNRPQLSSVSHHSHPLHDTAGQSHSEAVPTALAQSALPPAPRPSQMSLTNSLPSPYLPGSSERSA